MITRPATKDEWAAMVALSGCENIPNMHKAMVGYFNSVSSIYPFNVQEDAIPVLWWLVWRYRRQIYNRKVIVLAKIHVEKQEDSEVSPVDLEKLRQWREATE